MTKLSNHVIVKCKLINQLVLTTEFSEIHLEKCVLDLPLKYQRKDV